jgi:hypothetical protein
MGQSQNRRTACGYAYPYFVITLHQSFVVIPFYNIGFRPLCTEVPEEQYDHRSLFDRLEEQRRKKEYEYEETHKLSNYFAHYSHGFIKHSAE